MKKIYVAAAAVMGLTMTSNAQILMQNLFNNPEDFDSIFVAAPPGTTPDASWYTFDNDGFPDGSGASTARADEWFIAYAFATADSLVMPSGDTNFVMASNSWFTTVQTVDNWLVTASVDIPSSATGAVLKFKSASFQTPLYLDGYEVLLSNSDNSISSFSDVLYTAAEYTSGASTLGSDFAAYTFAPSGAWIQGWNGTSMVSSELEFNPNGDGNVSVNSSGDSSRWRGVLTEHVINLGAYAGQTVFIAFHHNSTDDNLISIDDVTVDATTGVGAVNSVTKVNVYPNPTVDQVIVDLNLTEGSSSAILTITDIFGRVVNTQSLGMMAAGANKVTIDASGYANGTYNIEIKAENGVARTSFLKK
jgi:hypothetical protein